MEETQQLPLGVGTRILGPTMATTPGNIKCRGVRYGVDRARGGNCRATGRTPREDVPPYLVQQSYLVDAVWIVPLADGKAEEHMKVVLVGATGYIGPRLAGSLQGAGYEVTVVTRSPARGAKRLPQGVEVVGVGGYGDDAVVQCMQGADAVVNLAGANIGSRRWTKGRKRVLLNSRVDTTASLVTAMSQLNADERPSVFVSTSGIDYYGSSGDEVLTEESPAGDSFLADVCAQWEVTANKAEALGVRVVTMRMATVMGRGARPLQLRMLPFRFFAGGHFRPGTQWFCWVHLDDALGLYQFAIENDDVHGGMNVVAPGVLREKDAGSAIGRAMHRPSWLPVPTLFLRLAMGEQSDLVIHGRCAEPKKALGAGYRFQHPLLDGALKQVLG